MRKRIFTLLAALCLLLCLLPTAAFASQTGSKTDESRSYNFDLSAGGASEVRATTGETITVTLVLKRTDAQESADMYGMQTEIEYDDTFLQLVDGSVMTAPGIRWSDLGRRTGGRAFYLNFVSFKGGEAWEPEVVVGSFQMKVIGTKGVSQLLLHRPHRGGHLLPRGHGPQPDDPQGRQRRHELCQDRTGYSHLERGGGRRVGAPLPGRCREW